MILRGIDVGLAAARRRRPASSERAAALYPQTLTRACPSSTPPSAFGGVAPAELLRPERRPAAIARRSPSGRTPRTLTIRTPLRIQQGEADTTVFKAFTDQLVAGYSAGAEER